MQKLIKYLGHAFRTLFGFYQRSYSESWDYVLSEFLTNGTVELDSAHTCVITLNDATIRVWVSNKFYSYGHQYNNGKSKEFRPRFETMLLLEERIDELKRKAKKEEANKYENEMRSLYNKVKQ